MDLFFSSVRPSVHQLLLIPGFCLLIRSVMTLNQTIILCLERFMTVCIGAETWQMAQVCHFWPWTVVYEFLKARCVGINMSTA